MSLVTKFLINIVFVMLFNIQITYNYIVHYNYKNYIDLYCKISSADI